MDSHGELLRDRNHESDAKRRTKPVPMTKEERRRWDYEISRTGEPKEPEKED